MSWFYDSVPLVESLRLFCCEQVISVPVIICLFCFASWQKTQFLSAVHISGVHFLLQRRKKKSGIYQTSAVHAKHMSICIRIYVYRYLYLYLSPYSYRYSLHCTYLSFLFMCVLHEPLAKTCVNAFVCVSVFEMLSLAACSITEDELFGIFGAT